jgi:hypothetical protein
MIRVFPGAGRGLDSFELTQTHELFLGGLSNEAAALPRTDERINVSYELIG